MTVERPRTQIRRAVRYSAERPVSPGDLQTSADTSVVVGSFPTPSAVEVLSPNGGAAYELGDELLVSWFGADKWSSWRVELSRDDGETWETLAAGLAGTARSFTWTVAGSSSVQCRVRVTGKKASTYSDTSDAAFEIFDADAFAVTEPNGGESFQPESAVAIEWTYDGLFDSFDIELSRDNGSSWETIASDLDGDDTSYEWTADPPGSSQCKARVIGHKSSGDYSDESDAVFTVVSPSVTVTSPNGGETITLGTSHNVTWSKVGTFASFSIDVSSDGGSNWSSVATGISGAATLYAWSVSGSVGSNYRIRVVGAYSLGGSYSDSSNASFSLALPTLTVTAPNGGESLTVGVSTTISWTVNTGSFSGFNIERSENAGSSWTTIASGLGSGVTSQSWTPTVATTQGLIRVTGTGTYGNSDTSNANFTVVDLPWVNISTTLLFFVADDATGTTNVTSQTDRKGNGTLTDGLTPYLTRQGGGRRYGSATALATGALIRTSAGPSGTGGSGVLHGMLLSGLLASLGWFADVGSGFHEGTRCYVTATHILLQGRNSGSGTTTRSCAHGGISNGVRHSFGWSYLSGETTTFYLDGVAIGTGSSPGNSFGAGGKWHIGALEYTFGTAQNQNAQGAFIAGMVASGIMTAQQHADVHAYMNALPA